MTSKHMLSWQMRSKVNKHHETTHWSYLLHTHCLGLHHHQAMLLHSHTQDNCIKFSCFAVLWCMACGQCVHWPLMNFHHHGYPTGCFPWGFMQTESEKTRILLKVIVSDLYQEQWKPDFLFPYCISAIDLVNPFTDSQFSSNCTSAKLFNFCNVNPFTAH